jgi:GNAT superfamily N-acetyltransferase
MVSIDYENRMTLVGIAAEEEPECNEKFMAMGEYIKENAAGSLDLAVTIHSDFQGCGIGSFMFLYLVQIAKEHGITGFMADVFSYNEPIKDFKKNVAMLIQKHGGLMEECLLYPLCLIH